VNKPGGIAAAKAAPRAKAGAKGFDRGAFYRLCRMLHAYLSAFAFLALIFFAGTGLLINHPDWIPAKPHETEARLSVPAAALAAAARAADPAAALAEAVAKATPLVGAYRSGEVADGQADLRFEGAKGSSTVTIDLKTGAAEATVDRAGGLAVVGDLHRGKNAGAVWRAVIDASAVLVLALSVIGYVLFFSLRFRLRTSLVLTAGSLAVMLAIYLFATV
jgi:hypothetical protein